MANAILKFKNMNLNEISKEMPTPVIFHELFLIATKSSLKDEELVKFLNEIRRLEKSLEDWAMLLSVISNKIRL